MSIGSQIEELLYDKNISQRRLAEDLKISPSTLNGYIRDYREPDAETLKILANYFDVTIDYLLEYNASDNENIDRFLNQDEKQLLGIYRGLKKDQQELLIEQGKLLLKMSSKKIQKSSITTSKTGSLKIK